MVELRNALLVDPDAPVTHLTPAILHRSVPDTRPAPETLHERQGTRDA
jgi:hypothetical protein